ncbi:hypothetical protein [Peptostreptococcus sp. D1]|uniref:hypothetical protein n=1 Tax=Peptostreptococcus sp. D1 TaxID=72304 RepID=UPI0008E4FC97|nr:hypothetical protein [Peptostreptococcus sp. D1]SFE42371.1 hypothetical protein SAMN02910278_00789 [Peptostreptococcus sp. D1]
MKKSFILGLIVTFSISLVGCGFNESGQLMSDARTFIEKAEYDKAMDNLSKVLQEDETNVEARGMYYQAMKLQKADRAKYRKDYEQEIKELQDLINDNQGSAKIRSQAEEKLDLAQKAFKSQRNASITRKENAKKTAEENKSKYATSSIYGRKYTQNTYNSSRNSSSSGSGKTTTGNTGGYGAAGNSGSSTNMGAGNGGYGSGSLNGNGTTGGTTSSSNTGGGSYTGGSSSEN